MILKNIKKLFPFYPYIIAALILLLCLLVWPLGLLGHTSYQSASLAEGISGSLPLSGSSVAAGEFTPARKWLEGISFRFSKSGQETGGDVTLELYNSAQTPVASVSVEAADIMNYRWVSFPLDFHVSPGQTYTWRLYTSDCPEDSLTLYTGSPSMGPGEAGAFFYNNEAMPGLSPYVAYTYRDRPDFERALPYDILFFICGLLLFYMCRKFETIDED